MKGVTARQVKDIGISVSKRYALARRLILYMHSYF